MQRRKNIGLLVSLVVLLIITGFIFWRGTSDHSSSIDKNLFRVEDFKAISRITLQSPDGLIDLTFNGSKWKVNSQFDADPAMVDVLFATLQQVEAKRPVALAQTDSISKALEQVGTKVSLYAGEQLEKSFLAGGNPLKTLAYYKLQESEPYVMTIPGYRVYAAGIFELRESGWKDKFVFGFNWRNFQELEATFPAAPKDDFKVAMNKNYFGIEGIVAVDTANLNTYLDQVSLLTVDQYIDNATMADSLKRVNPQLIVRVRDIARREYSLKIFFARRNGGYVMGLMGDSQLALFDPEKIIPLLKGRDFFRGK